MVINKLPQTSTSGFVALMAVICISLLLLLLTVQVTTLGWYTRSSVLEKEFKARSVALAHSCATSAVIHVVYNPSYQGNATSTDPAGSCYVFPLQPHTPTPTLLTVKVQAVVARSYTTLIVVYDMHDINLDPIPKVLPANGSENLIMSLSEWHEVQ